MAGACGHRGGVHPHGVANRERATALRSVRSVRSLRVRTTRAAMTRGATCAPAMRRDQPPAMAVTEEALQAAIRAVIQVSAP